MAVKDWHYQLDDYMKILIVHNAYQHYGGEDAVVRSEYELLKAFGNAVNVDIVSNELIGGIGARLRAGLGTVFSVNSYLRIRSLLKDIRPDVVHVHNFFPLVSPSVFFACRSVGVPVVFTLHNYRIICPTALLMHNGQVTERSIGTGPWWAFLHRVYRGSLAGTFLLCLMISFHRRIGTWRVHVDRLIVLTQFAQQRFAAAGIPTERMEIKPNFVDVPAFVESERVGLFFVGRLSTEKGIDVLVTACRRLLAVDGVQEDVLAVAGDGPLRALVEASGAQYLGALPSHAVRCRMQAAVALVLPSIWYEGFPMVLVEAYASGLPVIASRIGALAELVEDGVTGLLFEPGNADELATKMAWALSHPDEMRRMGAAARTRYEACYTPDRNYEQLMSIYRNAIAHSGKSDHQPQELRRND